MAQIRLANIHKTYTDTPVLDDVSIDIRDGEFMVFVGPSGCGKTTLLRTIAGLEKPTSGHVRIGEDDVTRWPPARRGVAMVFQSYALYPHMTVRENIAFGLRLSGLSKEQTAERVREAAASLQIDHLLDRRPRALSGGQRQRVAIGRAIVRQPKAFLFDEPLSNLDAELRVQMRVELIALHQRLGSTMVYVTHDQVEAMTMADRIVVLNKGEVEQIGSPLDLYHRPRNRFVASFIGSPRMNFLTVRVTAASPAGARVQLPGGKELSLPIASAALKAGDMATLGIRPEHIGLDGNGASTEAVAEVVENLGSEILVHARIADDLSLTVRAQGHERLHHGDRLSLSIPPERCHLFGADDVALAPQPELQAA